MVVGALRDCGQIKGATSDVKADTSAASLDAQYWGSCTEYPNCTPIWANRPDVGIAHYVRHLQEVREAAAAQ